jgi:protoporphyrinogen oxidase
VSHQVSPPITILGAGIAGLSASYHFGHERCVLFESRPTWGGHAGSEQSFGYTFDRGPHVSFTKHDYVRELFEKSVGGEFLEFEVRTRNFFRGHWIDHPAQVHLWQVPEPLRQKCCDEMLAVADEVTPSQPPANYGDWLRQSFGPTFATTFPGAYTQKYWTVGADEMSCDWLGGRMHRPNRTEIEAGMRSGAQQALHYITRVRYPSRGGYQSFMAGMARGANIEPGREVASIDLEARRLWFADGRHHDFERLVSTLPLDSFLARCQRVPSHVREAAEALECSQLLLVNVCAPHSALIDGHWFYVYDQELRSTRIHLAERLSPNNAPTGNTAVQVECYFGRRRPFPGDPDGIATEVVHELVTMGFIDRGCLERGEVNISWRWASHANVIFTHARREALDTVLGWLEQFGLAREADDLDPARDWSGADGMKAGRVMLAGRFAQWKYFWTDDCVLRGRQLAEAAR